MPRYFNTGDRATDVNLERLDHLATFDRFDGEAAHVHDWIVGVIRTHKMLPPTLARKIQISFYMIGDEHYHWSHIERPKQWKRLVDRLAEEMAKVAEEVGCDGVPGTVPLDLSGRPETRGERVATLCTKLRHEGIDTSEGARLLRQIAMNPIPGISGDLRELERLAKRKRKPADYLSKVDFHLAHMHIVAQGVHWMD